MKPSNYFQGILQLRNVNEEIIDWVLLKFEKEKVGIAKIVKLKNGVDLYSASNKFSRRVGHFLYKKYGGELKENPKLFSRNSQTSKNIYRLNVLFRCPDYLPGDVIYVKDKVIKITSVSGDVLKGTNLENGKRTSMKLGRGAKVEKLPIFEAQIVKCKPSIEILNPETYQSEEVINPFLRCKTGDLVSVVKFNGNFVLVL